MYPDKIVLFTTSNGTEIGFYLYGLLIGLGIAVCFLMLWGFSKHNKVDTQIVDFTTYGAIASIIVGFFSAYLFQAIYEYIEDPSAGFDLFGSGLTFLGGLLGGCATYVVIYFGFKTKLKLHFIDISSVVPCSITIAHSFGRFGCFCAGCCYGIETDGPLGVVFKGMKTAVYPTQLFEAVFLLVLCAVMSFLLLKFKFQYNFSVYTIAYGIFRFLIEFIRDDDRGSFVPSLTPSQFWSILMVVGGIGSIFFIKWCLKRRKATMPEATKVTIDMSKLHEENM